MAVRSKLQVLNTEIYSKIIMQLLYENVADQSSNPSKILGFLKLTANFRGRWLNLSGVCR
jgi:hypothetical protein